MADPSVEWPPLAEETGQDVGSSFTATSTWLPGSCHSSSPGDLHLALLLGAEEFLVLLLDGLPQLAAWRGRAASCGACLQSGDHPLHLGPCRPRQRMVL